MRQNISSTSSLPICVSGNASIFIEKDGMIWPRRVRSQRSKATSYSVHHIGTGNRYSFMEVGIRATKPRPPMTAHRITMEDGSSLELSGCQVLVHRLDGTYSVDVAGLSVNDSCVIPKRLPRKNLDISVGYGRGRTRITENLAHFAGMCLGGNAEQLGHNGASITLNADWRVDKLISDVNRMAGSKWKVNKDSYKYTIHLTGGCGLSMLRALSCFTSDRIPAEFFNMSPEYQISFLGGYFAAAGCLSNQGDNKILYCSASTDVAEDLVLMMRQLCIVPKVYQSTLRTLIEVPLINFKNSMKELKNIHSDSMTAKYIKISKIEVIESDDMYLLSPADTNILVGSGLIINKNGDSDGKDYR